MALQVGPSADGEDAVIATINTKANTTNANYQK
jgi:hypothetical protein